MSKCLKCGAALPPVGECPACAAAAVDATQPGNSTVPSLLDKDIHIDRRRTPELTPAVTEPAVPSFADLARGPATPPGLTPARHAAAPAQPPPMPPAQRLPVAPSMPAAQAAMAHQAVPPPQRIPIPSPASAPQPQRIPVPAPAAQATTAPHAAPRVPLPGVPAQAVLSQGSTQRAELPMASESPHAPPLAPEPGTGSRHQPPPVSVMTFSPPSRLPVPPPHGALPSDELLTPRLPQPTLPPESPAAAQLRGRPSSAPGPATGVQELHARPASLWRRLLSFTIDTAAIVGVATLYITLASSIAGVKAPSSQGLTTLDSLAAWMHALKAVLLPGAVLLLVLATAYCAVAAFVWNGRTLGRLLLGLRLVDTHGVAPAPTRAIIRAILSVVSFGLFLGGFWMALFDKRGQTLHDKLTSTFVIQPS